MSAGEEKRTEGRVGEARSKYELFKKKEEEDE